MPHFTKLFEPIQIGTLELRNRTIMAAMDTGLENEGFVTDSLRAFYLERARGGVGLIITGSMNPPRWGRACHASEAIYFDDAMEGWAALIREVHAEGARMAAQFSHAGRHARSGITGVQPIAPSPIPSPHNVTEVPRELSTEEVRLLIADFVDGARRAREVGFDAVELHGAAGFLVTQFLSPLTNQRADEFGGSLENRLRFPLEIVRGIKEQVGASFPVIYRMSADDLMPGGLSLEANKVIAQHLVAAGVDCINVTAGWHEAPVPQVVTSVPRGGFAYLASGIKQAVSVPVSACNRINDPEVAERILRSGQSDLITMGRAWLAEPEWIRKAQEGRLGDIRHCVACCDCLDRAFQNLEVRCSINPFCGREEELRLHPTKRPRRILVIGGGPAGMQAATIAAQRGHDVTLCERSPQLGGELVPGTVAPHKEELAGFRQYLIGQLEKSGARVQVETEVTPAMVAELHPEAVVVANGAQPIVPRIPGADRPNVVTADQVLRGKPLEGKRVVIIGAGWVGCETAELMAMRGKQVTLVEMLPRIGADISPSNRWVLLDQLRVLGVATLTKSKALEITDAGVLIEREGQQQTIEADATVLSVGYRPDTHLAEQLKGQLDELYVIGDAAGVRRINAALREATELAHEL
ncbi:MAG: FAD-dependent oxidoreductase [Chloroflexota bacterium]|nr:MAG: FAD-dependent oxidoreductase [Chloroflexota bacterium]